MACSLPSLISGFAVMLLPESPKFLMSRGYNDAAMKVFNHIHKVNNGNNVEYSVNYYHQTVLNYRNLCVFVC